MRDWAEFGRTARRLEIPSVIALYLLLRALGWVAPIEWWIFPVLIVVAAFVSALVTALWGRVTSGPLLWLRIGPLVLAITATMYATGWGPMLAVGYVFLLGDVLHDIGTVATRPMLVLSLLGLALGQLAIQLGWAPTFVATPDIHGLAVLSAAGLSVAILIIDRATRRQQEAETEVRRSEERFRALVQNATDMIMVVGTDEVVQYVSPAAERELGWKASELEGRRALELVHPDDLDSMKSVFSDVAERAGELIQLDLRMRTREGEWRWFEVGATNRLADPSVNGFVANFHNVTERRRFQDELTYRAFHDGLTNLPNRAGFMKLLERALDAARRAGGRVGVLFLDVDRLKLVNDGLGHETGDRLLVEFASRLSRCIRPSDTVARFGGDEFTVLVERLILPDDAVGVAGRITSALQDPVWIGDREIIATCSIGIALSDDRTVDASDLVRDADLAMYLAKERGGARWEVFDAEQAPEIVGRLELEADLWRAVDSDQLEVYFQPEVALSGGEVVALEALIRWHHPTRGLLLPSSFIPFAEESSLILAVDRLALREACRRGREWQQVVGGSLRISVNLSPRFLRQPDAVADVVLALQAGGFDAECLQLEITERMALTDETQSLQNLADLRSLGIKVAIDDFGTGYSSLGYLKQLPVDVLKLDKSFIDGVASIDSDGVIARAVVSMGHALGLRVTAEGVERPEQAEYLRSIGCDTAQGWHWARAQPPDQVEDLLRYGLAEWEDDEDADEGMSIPVRRLDPAE